MSTIQSIEQIAVDPAIRSGRPHLVGTTVTVADVATVKIFHRLDAEAVAEWFDLPLAKIYAALAYYYEHKVDIDASIEERRLLAARMKEQRVGSKYPPLP
jgi:uncharacterized protein (DUF433 family)